MHTLRLKVLLFFGVHALISSPVGGIFVCSSANVAISKQVSNTTQRECLQICKATPTSSTLHAIAQLRMRSITWSLRTFGISMADKG